MGVRDLAYRLYEHRIEASLSPRAIPRHVGVMCDGNRRWARSAGLADVSSGHQAGADKIFEVLQWCRQTGVEVVTLWLLSTDNLSRSSAELEPLLRIIEDTVRELVAQNWHVNPMGALDLLPADTTQVLKDAADATANEGGLLVNVAVGYVLIWHVGDFDLRNPLDAVAARLCVMTVPGGERGGRTWRTVRCRRTRRHGRCPPR